MTTITTLTTTTLDEKRPAVYHEELLIEQRENTRVASRTIQTVNTPSLTQRALLLHAAQQPYALVTDHAIPTLLHKDEILIKVRRYPSPSSDQHPKSPSYLI
jgi:hypothetical protein